jgi:hypothetical protein
MLAVKIFLSHSIRDREWCEWLKASAQEMGITAYLSEHDPAPGRNLADKIKNAIDTSDAVVVLLTDNSVDAPYVNQEIGYALKGDKLIIPLVQPGIPHERLAMLQGVEYIPFDFEAPHEGQLQLRIALNRLVRQQALQRAQKDQTETVLLVLACVALVFLTLES